MGNIEKVSGNSPSSLAIGGASMSSLGLRCPACQKKMSVPDHALGRRVQCPKCEHVFRYTGQRDLTLGRVLPRGSAPATPMPMAMLAEDMNLGDTLPMTDLELDVAKHTHEPASAMPKTEASIEMPSDDEIAELLGDEPSSLAEPEPELAGLEDSPVDIVEDEADLDEVAEIDEIEEIAEVVEEPAPAAPQATPVDEAIDDLLAEDAATFDEGIAGRRRGPRRRGRGRRRRGRRDRGGRRSRRGSSGDRRG